MRLHRRGPGRQRPTEAQEIAVSHWQQDQRQLPVEVVERRYAVALSDALGPVRVLQPAISLPPVEPWIEPEPLEQLGPPAPEINIYDFWPGESPAS